MAQIADVLVVGGGIAGVAAMIEARVHGATVAGVDAQSGLGGTGQKAAAGTCIAGTPLQRRLGIEDSPALALADLLRDNDSADEVWARRYFEQSATELYGWMLGIGIEFEETIYANEDDSVARWHIPRGGGAEVIRHASRRLADLGVDPDAAWRFGVTVDELLWDDDRVAGVAVDGEELHAGCVVMATGGFAGNHELVEAWCPPLAGIERVLAGGGRGAQGSGHELLARHGATLVNIDQICSYAAGTPFPGDPTGRSGVVARTLGTWVWVNAAGHRFLEDESAVTGAGSAIDVLLAQPGQRCWAIVDAIGVDRLLITDHLVEPPETNEQSVRRLLATSRHVRRGVDVAALAAELGVDPVALAESCRELGDGPFTAIELFPLARKNLGGISTDERCRVFDGLYAAGELTGFGGGHMTGSKPLEGMMFGGSLFSGRIAGREAARAAAAARSGVAA